jgi:hypothetical protein
MVLKPSSKEKSGRFRKLKTCLVITGITVSPAITQLDLASDSGTFNLRYTNNTSAPVQLTFRAQDFTSLENGWRVKFLDAPEAKTYRYSLSSWLEFSPPSLLLTPDQSGNLAVSVRKESLSGGGHYASIIADIAAAPAPPGENVNIKSQLVSLVFVRTQTGFEREEGKITQFESAGSGFLSLPKSFLLDFENPGNTYLTPHGLVTIRDFLNREVARGILNTDSLIVLPESIRRFEIPVTVKQVKWFFPGPYQATLAVNYGTGRQSLTSRLDFVSFGDQLNLVIPILILLAVGFAISRVLKKVKRRQKLSP